MRKIFFLLLFIPLMTSAFSDVSIDNRNAQAIQHLKSQDIIGGYADGTFKPNNKINRAELMKILVAGKGLRPNTAFYKNCFSDVQEEWFASFVCYAKEKGWINGYDDGTFRPAQFVKKVEAIKMVLNSYEITVENDLQNGFPDVDSSAWYAPYVLTAHKHGFLEGTSTYNPAEEITRGGVSENIYRVLMTQSECESAFHLENKNCISNQEECSIQNGVGIKTWENNTWSSCKINSCEIGYIEENGRCEQSIEIKSLNDGTKYYLHFPCVANDGYKWCSSSDSEEICENLGLQIATEEYVRKFLQEKPTEFPCVGDRVGSCERGTKKIDTETYGTVPYAVLGITDNGSKVYGLSNMMCIENQ